MKHYETSDLRNFAIVGHGAVGKTTLAEAMLSLGNEVNRMGSVDLGTTVSDYHPGEKDRKISIHSTPLHMDWGKTKFNFIDAPGYSDFIGESIGSLGVVDMAAVLIHAVNGIEVGTESMWRTASACFAHEASTPHMMGPLCKSQATENTFCQDQCCLQKIRLRIRCGMSVV